MNIVVKDNNNNRKDYKAGDLFAIELTDIWGERKICIYQLINVYGEYMLIRCDDVGGEHYSYSGFYSTIADLFDDLFTDNGYIVAHYPKDEYELVLARKEEEI